MCESQKSIDKVAEQKQARAACKKSSILKFLLAISKKCNAGGVTMHGSFKYQISSVFSTILRIGESKHEAKSEAREKIEASNQSATWHSIGKETGIYSYKTYDLYFNITRELAEFSKQNYKIKDITKLTSSHVNAFLQSKIDQNLSKSTLQLYFAAIEKLEVAVNHWLDQYQPNNEKVIFDLQKSREVANNNLTKADQHRAYSNPEQLISAIKDNTFKIIASVQLEGGARIREINYLKLSQFNDDNKSIEVRGKGGYKREIKLTSETYNQLKQIVTNSINSDNNKFIFSEDKYRNTLKESARQTKQSYNGSHGLRWNFAQNEMLRLQIKENYTYDQARAAVSESLGHHRIDITDHYLQ